MHPLVADPARRSLFAPHPPPSHFPRTIKWEPACSSPLCARSLPFGWSSASSSGLVPPWPPLNEKVLWAGAFFKSDLICACPGHRALCLSFWPQVCCGSGAHTSSQHCLSLRPRKVTPWERQFWCQWMSQGPGFKSVWKEPPWKYPFLYFEICGVYSEETLWLWRKYRQENRPWWSLMQL